MVSRQPAGTSAVTFGTIRQRDCSGCDVGFGPKGDIRANNHQPCSVILEATASAWFHVWFNVGVDVAVLVLFGAPLLHSMRE